MPSLRLDIERAMGLKFPERDGEALVRFEESLEIPRPAETLMRGFYRHPERVRRDFQTLHQETVSILDILLPRRSRLKEWAEEPPERPQEAETFLRETGDRLSKNQQRLTQVESELMAELQENNLADLFPVPLTAFGTLSLREPAVKIYLRPLGRLAEISHANPEQLRQAVRIHFLFLLLLAAGQDLDGQGFTRASEEPTLHTIVAAYTWRYLKRQSAELVQCYLDWLNAWGAKKPSAGVMGEGAAERLRAAMIFWRRQPGVGWEECWHSVSRLERGGEEEESQVFSVRI
ncbi:hypothetical protein CEB3_c34580 [Peptococcaceae bacterium CEB3]|nr:hypothetical protein CEB3_c34580 [Peptococcaceae bacterium CEB3]